jgi:hypothetical protein
MDPEVYYPVYNSTFCKKYFALNVACAFNWSSLVQYDYEGLTRNIRNCKKKNATAGSDYVQHTSD